jgi:hypothetical protein
MKRMPLARKEGLEIQEVVDEVLIYDLERHHAHALNTMAALVWRHCDGKTSLATTARVLEAELDMSADADLVRFVLARLAKAHLLDHGFEEGDGARYSRRAFVKKLKKLGLAASVALPVVVSIVSPTPAHAQTCIPNSDCAGRPDCTPCANPGGTCEPLWMCCNGQCSPPGQARNRCGC